MQRHRKKGLTPEQAFAGVLREYRLKRGISQEKLGFESGYHRTYIGMLEHGRMNPSLRTLLSIASVLEIPVGELVQRVQDVVGRDWRGDGENPKP